MVSAFSWPYSLNFITRHLALDHVYLLLTLNNRRFIRHRDEIVLLVAQEAYRLDESDPAEHIQRDQI